MSDKTTISVTGNDGEVLVPPMPVEDFRKAVDDFALEPSDGNIPPRVIDELCAARTTAKDYAEAYTAAVTGQAEKYKINAAALKRYINARQADKMADLNAELSDLEKLIG